MSLDHEPTAPRASAPRGRWGEYTQLSRQIRQAGLLERRRGWYAARIGLNLALLVGVSFGWWVPKHNDHHSNPNHEDLDPDIGITALAFTTDQARAKSGLVRLIVRHQGWLFFPLLLLEAAHLHLASIKSVLRGSGRANTIEELLLLAHVAAYLGAVVWVLSPLQAIAFVVVQQGLFGSYAQALRHLHSVGAPLRPAGAAE
jgi:fatty acid desaturase